MKYLILFSVFLGLAISAQAQQAQQVDSTPPVLGWGQADTSGLSLSDGVGISTLPSLDTAWIGASPMLRSVNSALWKWEKAPVATPDGAAWFWLGSSGYVTQLNYPGDYTFRTTDVGQTWDTMGPPPPKYTAVGCMLSPSTMYSCGSSFIGRTTDSGKTWTSQEVNAAQLTSISFGDAEVGYAIDGEGISGISPILATRDGGDTWFNVDTWFTDVRRMVPHRVVSVFAIDRHTILVAGDAIFRTSDGGSSWDSVYNDGGFFCFKGRFGFAVGGAGGSGILASSDSGLTWHPQSSPAKAQLYSVAMYDSVHAVATGANGTILVTSNGGLSWVNENPPAPDSLTIQAFPNPVTTTFQLSYILKKGEHVTLTILDPTGAVVETPLKYVWQGGPETVSLDVSSLASGTYFYSLTSEDYGTSGSFTVLH